LITLRVHLDRATTEDEALKVRFRLLQACPEESRRDAPLLPILSAWGSPQRQQCDPLAN